MPTYTMLFETPAGAPCKTAAFLAETPARAFILAQNHHDASHLFADGSYLCTLECPGPFWLIVDDAANAQELFAISNVGRSITPPTRVFARLESKWDSHTGPADRGSRVGDTRLPELASVE